MWAWLKRKLSRLWRRAIGRDTWVWVWREVERQLMYKRIKWTREQEAAEKSERQYSDRIFTPEEIEANRQWMENHSPQARFEEWKKEAMKAREEMRDPTTPG